MGSELAPLVPEPKEFFEWLSLFPFIQKTAIFWSYFLTVLHRFARSGRNLSMSSIYLLALTRWDQRLVWTSLLIELSAKNIDQKSTFQKNHRGTLCSTLEIWDTEKGWSSKFLWSSEDNPFLLACKDVLNISFFLPNFLFQKTSETLNPWDSHVNWKKIFFGLFSTLREQKRPARPWIFLDN